MVANQYILRNVLLYRYLSRHNTVRIVREPTNVSAYFIASLMIKYLICILDCLYSFLRGMFVSYSWKFSKLYLATKIWRIFDIRINLTVKLVLFKNVITYVVFIELH